MKNKPKIAVLGGDLRQQAVARELSKYDVSVCTCGLVTQTADIKEIIRCDEFAEAVQSAAAVVLPLPASTDGVSLNCPSAISNERITLDEIVELLDADALLCGGRIPQNITVKAQAKGVRVYDYFNEERLQIKNAYITAEAALSIAMNSLEKCVRDARFVITGTGRIARLLAELLVRIGADVTVAARNADSLAYFELMGCEVKQIKEGTGWNKDFRHGYDIIFNTVPAWLFDRAFLEKSDKKLLIIELASATGGVDKCAARELSSNVLWASSLPGKYAPHSAGVLIAECIAQTLSREEVGIL